MVLEDVCLTCGHTRSEHNPGKNMECLSPHCPCLNFKSNTLQEI